MQCHLSKMRITDLSEGSVIDSDHSNSVKSFDLCCYFFTACFEVVCWTGHALDYTLARDVFECSLRYGVSLTITENAANHGPNTV